MTKETLKTELREYHKRKLKNEWKRSGEGTIHLELLETMMGILEEKERFIVETHLINHKSWEKTMCLFEER